MTSSEDHFRAAEKYLEEAESHREPYTRAQWCLELAKIHLALSQATRAASPKPGGEYPHIGSLPGRTAPSQDSRPPRDDSERRERPPYADPPSNAGHIRPRPEALPEGPHGH